jgi:diaminopropionate ammonia-lyase
VYLVRVFWLRSGPRIAAPFFAADQLDDVRRFYAGAQVTPLRRLDALAHRIGIGELLVKDETGRFGLTAFKILGVRYAMHRVAAGRALTDVACATAGNHGLAVARVARERGLEAHIYVPVGTAPARIDALRAEDAHVVVTSVDYDDTVRLMADDAAEDGWTIVSDTAWEGYETIPRWIMAGYTRLMDEAAAAWIAPPDVVIVQAGVGSLAGSVAGWLQATFDVAGRPALLIVEPEGSACVRSSLAAGRPERLPSCAPTSMTGLRCGEMSPLAWPVLAATTDAAVGISDAIAAEGMRALVESAGDDPAIAAGASGAAGVAALHALADDATLAPLRRHLRLSKRTRALAIATEAR